MGHRHLHSPSSKTLSSKKKEEKERVYSISRTLSANLSPNPSEELSQGQEEAGAHHWASLPRPSLRACQLCAAFPLADGPLQRSYQQLVTLLSRNGRHLEKVEGDWMFLHCKHIQAESSKGRERAHPPLCTTSGALQRAPLSPSSELPAGFHFRAGSLAPPPKAESGNLGRGE